MRPPNFDRTKWLGKGLGQRERREVRRDRHALRPCLEGCERRLLLSSTGTGGVTIYTGSGSGGFGSG
jgi:hypothetical protein